MAFLLDTHILLWLAADSPRLPPRMRVLADDPAAELIFSVASLWEITIKNSLGRADFSVDPRALRRAALASGIGELAIRGHQLLKVAQLPALHADPFDRVLLAQASTESLTLLTADDKLLAYGSPAQRA